MRKLLICSLILFFSTLTAWAETPSYTYIEANDLQNKMSRAEPLVLLDIQFPIAYNYQHLQGALPTYSYPLKTEASKAKLIAAVPQLHGSEGLIVIISTRGGGGAMLAFDLLKDQGIAAERLAILRSGQQRWPFPELTEKTEE